MVTIENNVVMWFNYDVHMMFMYLLFILQDNVSDGDDKGGDDEQEGALDRAKNRLQEALQAKGCMLPYYTLKHQYGPDHSPTFTVTLTVLNRAGRTIHMEEASASQKPRAEKLCAHRALPTVKTLLDNMCDEELNQVGIQGSHSIVLLILL